MKKLTNLLFLSILFIFSSCSKEIENVNTQNADNNTEKMLKSVSPKVLSGTFIDFWSKGDWTQAQWDSHFQEMKDIGMTTVIVQFASYGDYTWFNSANTFTKTKYPNALGRLLTAAATKQMQVYIGLYFDESYWSNQTNVSWLQLHSDRCNQIAAEIQAQFGGSPAFAGWYIPHEPEPYAYNSPALVASFKDNMVNRISNYLHTLNSKPVSIAAFFNSSLSTTTQVKNFMSELSKCNLQIIMMQDGVGVKHVTLDKVGSYYQSADDGLYNTGTGYAGQFWTDLETFCSSPKGPATIASVKSQLQSELAAPHISKAVSFQYYNDMCPTGPNRSKAAKLRTDYINYLKNPL